MPSDARHTVNGDAVKQFPPVAPPSARHIAQLFLVPGIIVAVFVLGYLGWKRFTHSWYAPENFLKRLDNTNPDVRWRAAEDLAQVLLRDDELAADPEFGLGLAQRLRQAIDANVPSEKAFAEQSATASTEEKARAAKALEGERNYIEYLIACLGSFSVPVGAPVLNKVATDASGPETDALAHRRLRAVWALANLGDNLKRFDRLAPEQKAKALDSLRQETEQNLRGDWARACLGWLEDRADGHPSALGVDATMAECAKDKDPFVRQMVAMGLNYWQGDAEENARMEQTLQSLMRDDGHGAKEEPELRALEIRAQAAVALARRGSAKIKIETIRGMLDEKEQLERFAKALGADKKAQKAGLVYTTVSGMTKAVAELHRKDPTRDLSALYPALHQLEQSGNAALKADAKQTLIMLGQR